MAGPKKAVTADPLEFSGYPEDSAGRRLRFITDYLITPRGFGAGEPFKVRDFQREIVEGVFAAGVQTAVVSLPRGNGKTALAAALGLAELFVGPLSAQVLVVASDVRQAGITFNLARRMVELNPVLAERVQVYNDRLYVPHNDAELRPLPADYDSLQGWDPSLMVVDELHVVTAPVWEAVTSAAGKRPESRTLAISTPADNKDSVMWPLVEYGRTVDDPSFYLKEYAAPEGCEVDDRAAWRAANPALADADPFMNEAALVSVQKTIRESRFRQLRLGQWVSGGGNWIPGELWAECADPSRKVRRKSRIVLGFDGSASGDSTALVAATVEPEPYVWVVGVWEKPEDDTQWRVPREEVSETVAEMFETYNVQELSADPWGWRSELEQWQKHYGERKVVEFNTGFRKRMAPATDRFYQAVSEGRLSHDGHPRLAVHIGHAVATPSPQGDVITKDKKSSPRKIDLAVAAIVAVERASHYTKKRGGKVAVF